MGFVQAEHERWWMMANLILNYMKETQIDKKKPNVRWETRVVDNKIIWFPVKEEITKFKRR